MEDQELYTYSEFKDRAVAKITESNNNVSDFNPGSIVRALLDGVLFFAIYLQARIKKAYRRFLYSTAEGDDLDERVEELQLTRRAARKATGVVTFTANSAPLVNVDIPYGTTVSTQPDDLGNTIDFIVVDLSLFLPSGSTSVTGNVECTVAGTIGNVEANTVTSLTDTVSGIDSVNNAAVFGDGAEEETDDQLRARVPLKLNSLKKGTQTALEEAAFSVEGITFVKIAARTPSAGYNTIYVNNDSGSITEELKDEVQDAIDAAAGFGIINIVAVPTSDYVTITFDLEIDDDFDSTVVKNNVKDAVLDFVNLNSDDVLKIADIINTVINISGVTNVKTVKINGTADDYETTVDKSIKLLSVNSITITEI